MGKSEPSLKVGPLGDFARGLRELRTGKGLTYRELARRTGYSAARLSAAAGGHTLPPLEVVRAFVDACGGDVAAWEERWRSLAATGQSDYPDRALEGRSSPELPTEAMSHVLNGISAASSQSSGTQPPIRGELSSSIAVASVQRQAAQAQTDETVIASQALIVLEDLRVAMIVAEMPGTSARQGFSRAAKQRLSKVERGIHELGLLFDAAMTRQAPLDRSAIEKQLAHVSKFLAGAPNLSRYVQLISNLMAGKPGLPAALIDRARTEMEKWQVQTVVNQQWSAYMRLTGRSLQSVAQERHVGERARIVRAIPSVVYLADGQANQEVEEALTALLQALDIDILNDLPPIRGSWFRLSVAKTKKALSSQELNDQLSKIERALQMPILLRPQAEIDAAIGGAVANLISALASEANAIVQAGSILLIKIDGVLTVRNLTQVELAHLERNPELLMNPDQALCELQRVAIDPGSVERTKLSESTG